MIQNHTIENVYTSADSEKVSPIVRNRDIIKKVLERVQNKKPGSTMLFLHGVNRIAKDIEKVLLADEQMVRFY